MSKTYSTTIEITEEKEYSVTINAGLDLSEWITAGSTTEYPLNPSSYADFSALEADEAAVRQLMTVHASVDYLAQATAGDSLMQSVINSNVCAKWINISDYALDTLYANSDIADEMDTADKYGYGEWGLVGQVPVMTSNTTPSGVASAQSEHSKYKAYGAIDGSSSSTSFYCSNTSVTKDVPVTEWWQYQSVNPIILKRIFFQTPPTNGTWDYNVSQLVVKGSNDGTTFTDLATFTDLGSCQVGKYLDIPNPNDDAYLYIRYLITESSSYNGGTNVPVIGETQFYAYAPLGNVPIMTANNAPYGVASRNSVTGSNEAYKAFSGSATATDRWLPNTNDTNNYLRYTFVNPVKAKKAKINFRHSPSLPQMTFSIRASNDGFTTYDTVGTVTVEAQSSAGNVEVEVDLTSNTYYMAYDLFCSTAMTITSYDIGVHSLQFYGRELKPLVPTMTSNNTPRGRVFAKDDSNPSSSAPWHAFSGINSYNGGEWGAENDRTYPSYIGYESQTKIKVSMFRFQTSQHSSSTPGAAVKDFILQGSNDGSTWTDIYSGTFPNNVYRIPLYFISENPDFYKYHRIYILNTYGTLGVTYPICGYIQFYGSDYSEKEFAQGSTRKTIYDHGVELVTLNSYTGSSSYGGFVNKKGYQIEAGTTNSTNNNQNTGFVYFEQDLSNYDTLNVVAGNTIVDQPQVLGGTGMTPSSGWAPYPASPSLNLKVLSKTNSIDVSQINQSYGIVFGSGRGVVYGSIAEWWLE